MIACAEVKSDAPFASVYTSVKLCAVPDPCAGVTDTAETAGAGAGVDTSHVPNVCHPEFAPPDAVAYPYTFFDPAYPA
jgi:hypothetical protein